MAASTSFDFSPGTMRWGAGAGGGGVFSFIRKSIVVRIKKERHIKLLTKILIKAVIFFCIFLITGIKKIDILLTRHL